MSSLDIPSPPGGGKRGEGLFSNSNVDLWSKDEDISRFLKSLPNWRSLARHRGAAAAANQCEESLEDIEKRNTKETEILVSNLGSSDIPAHEILSDPGQLR
jgi:exocyst complex component 4